MRVVQLNSGIRGLASYAINLVDHFRPLGDEHLVVSEAHWTKKDIGAFEASPRLIAGVLPWLGDIPALNRRLDEFKPDIIHHHHPSGRLDFHADRFKARYKAPLVTTVHMSVGSKRYMVDKAMHTLFMIDKRYFSTTDCYIAISRFVRNQMIELGIPKEKIVLLYAGVDPQLFKPSARPERDWLDVTFCGQITPEKGVDLLIRAVHDVSARRKIRLNLIGNGTHFERWKKWTALWPEINWIGFVKDATIVARTYAESDVVVLPTRWDEAFSYIPIEALSSGTAVIASATGGNLEAIQAGTTGFHFPQGDWKALCSILESADIAQLHAMGAAGRQYSLAHHTRELFGKKYERVYANLLRDPTRLEQVED
jgi:glycosyltransferase involved in cell wall biosynthesis